MTTYQTPAEDLKPAQQRALSIPCPTCHATVGESCTFRRYTVTTLHLTRQDKYTRQMRRGIR